MVLERAIAKTKLQHREQSLKCVSSGSQDAKAGVTRVWLKSTSRMAISQIAKICKVYMVFAIFTKMILNHVT